MQISFRLKGRTLIASISGEIDHHTLIEVKEKMERQFLKANILNIIFDFAGVTFIDSSGVGMIIGRYKQVENLGGRVGVINANRDVDRILSISGIYKIATSFATLDEALESL